MEMSIRQNRSAEISAAINQQFYNIIRLSEQADQITELGYQSTQLLQDIEENLPNLPTTREEQNVQSNTAQQATDNQQEQDWNKIKQEINQRIQQAIALYQQGESKKRFFPYKTPISTCLKALEWKTKWVLVIVTLKLNLKATLLVS